MARIVMLGAGIGGLSTAMLLARDGHEVTVLERDPADPPPPDHAWERWQRRGVSQFRLPHFMLPRWHSQMAEELPDVLADLRAAGGLEINLLSVLPEAARGPDRPDDARFATVTARRPVLEAVVAAAAERTPGVTIRRGVPVIGLVAEPRPVGQPSDVLGVLVAGGGVVRGDLVVDCCGRRSALGAWLAAVGARPPVEEREDCGFVYYARHLAGRTGGCPPVRAPFIQHYNSVTILTLPADNGTWCVVVTTSARDRELRSLREPSTFDAVLARYPLAAHWRDGEPISGVDVMAGIEDRRRRLVVDGRPVATGVVAVGDAWACTNPSLGRGASIGLLHGRLLRDLLREVDPADREKLVRRFDEVTSASVEPLYRATLWYDRHRLAEVDADIAGRPYHTDDQGWHLSKATAAAATADPEVARAYLSLSSLQATAADVYADADLVGRILALGSGAPAYPLPGPDRRELLATVAG